MQAMNAVQQSTYRNSGKSLDKYGKERPEDYQGYYSN